MSSAQYDADFFARHDDSGARAAAVILGILEAYFKPHSVVDVGCGSGRWLAECQRLFDSRVLGLDGDWNTTISSTGIPFKHVNLEDQLPEVGEFDLAICLEVAEHLTATAADNLIASLISMAPVVLFSAAIEEQPGEHHINCMWQHEWMEKFEKLGYRCLDVIRPQIWHNQEVAWWYKQNVFLAVRPGSEILSSGIVEQSSMNPTDVVHPENYVSTIQGHFRVAKETWARLEAAEKRLNSPNLTDLKDMSLCYVRRIVRYLVKLVKSGVGKVGES